MAFLIGSVATVAGTLVAIKLLPLTDMGTDGWKVPCLACNHRSPFFTGVTYRQNMEVMSALMPTSMSCTYRIQGMHGCPVLLVL